MSAAVIAIWIKGAMPSCSENRIFVAQSSFTRLKGRTLADDHRIGRVALHEVGAGTLINVDCRVMELAVMLAVPRFVETDVGEQFCFADMWQQQHPPTVQRLSLRVNFAGGRQRAMLALVQQQGQGNAAEIV